MALAHLPKDEKYKIQWEKDVSEAIASDENKNATQCVLYIYFCAHCKTKNSELCMPILT